MAYHIYIPAVTNGLVLNVDAYNTKSYISGNTDTYNLALNSVSGGTLINGVGLSEKAWTFDAVSDYIDIGKDSLLRPDEAHLNSKGWAIELWLNADTLGTFRGIFCNDSVNQTTYYGLLCSITTTGGFYMNKMDGTGSGVADRSSALTTTTFPINTWHHVVFNYVSANKADFEIYVNGVSQPVTTSGTGGSVAYSPSFNGAIGKYLNLASFGGQISNVRVYNRKLSSQEILQNYDALKWRFK